MGLPKINIDFFGKLKERPLRNAAGIVVLILSDDTQTEAIVRYTQMSEEFKGWTDDNTKFIKQTLQGGPRVVIAVSLPSSEEDYTVALNKLRNMQFDYLAAPGIEDAKAEVVADWIKKQRTDHHKKFKAVLPNCKANHEGIINFTASEIMVSDTQYTTSQYTGRIAGILAGLPFDRSATYAVLSEVDSIKEVEDGDAAVDNGELILIHDGEKVKIGRGVNSLVTLKPDDRKNDEFKSIRIVEIMDMVRDEIYREFNDNYIGKVPNKYDNQVLFITDVNQGFRELETLNLLDNLSDNYCEIDVEAQRAAWEQSGVDTSTWDDQKVKERSFKRKVFLRGKIRAIDTIEDLDFAIEV